MGEMSSKIGSDLRAEKGDAAARMQVKKMLLPGDVYAVFSVSFLKFARLSPFWPEACPHPADFGLRLHRDYVKFRLHRK
jgi:hypothetical protein